MSGTERDEHAATIREAAAIVEVGPDAHISPLTAWRLADAVVALAEHEGACRYCGILRHQMLPRPSYWDLRVERDEAVELLRHPNEHDIEVFLARHPEVP